MELTFNQKGVEHVSRHFATASEPGGKFNAKVNDTEGFLKVLTEYLRAKIGSDKLDWFHNEISGTDTASIILTADTKLKSLFGILPDEPFGYDGVVEITKELEAQVTRKPRGNTDADRLEVNVVSGISPKPTDIFIVKVKKWADQKRIFISTAYPGNLSPFLPNKENQTEQEYQKSLDYWNKHAFIE